MRIDSASTHAIDAGNLGGTSKLAASTVTGFGAGGTGDGFRVFRSDDGLATLTVTGTSFSSGQQRQGSAVRLMPSGAANMTVSIEGNSVFTDLGGYAVYTSPLESTTSGTVKLTVKDSTFSNARVSGLGNIEIAWTESKANLIFNIEHNRFESIVTRAVNSFRDTPGAVGVTMFGSSANQPTLNGTVRNNTIEGTRLGRSVSATIRGTVGQARFLIDNNAIDHHQQPNRPIVVETDESADVDVTITKNRIGQSATGTLWPVELGLNPIDLVLSGASVLRAKVSENIVDANTSRAALGAESRDSSTLHVTITDNDLQDTTASPRTALRVASDDTSVTHTTISGNTMHDGNVNLSETAGSSLTVTQTSTADLQSVNSGVAGVSVSGDVGFGQPLPTLPALPSTP
jgi:hypothetical protein